MEENKKSKGTGIVVTILLLLIIGLIVFVFVMFNKDKDKNEITVNNNNIENETINSQTNTNEMVSKFTLTEEEFPKVDGATAMLPMVGEITKKVLGYTDQEAQKYLDENTQGKSAKVYASLINKEKDRIVALIQE